MYRYEHKTVGDLINDLRDVPRGGIYSNGPNYSSQPGASVVEIYMNVQKLKYGHTLHSFSVTTKIDGAFVNEVFHFVWEVNV